MKADTLAKLRAFERAAQELLNVWDDELENGYPEVPSFDEFVAQVQRWREVADARKQASRDKFLTRPQTEEERRVQAELDKLIERGRP